MANILLTSDSLEEFMTEYNKFCDAENEKHPGWIYGWHSSHVFDFIKYYLKLKQATE